MSSPLLATKLYIPPPHPDLLYRPRLAAVLDETVRLGRRLVLISAPPGFGKTVLVAGWLAQRSQAGGAETLQGAWLTLDRNDNDPILFWRYLIAALQTAQPGIGQAVEVALAALHSQPSPQPPMEPLVTSLINDLAGLSTRLVLVLDDYHFIESDTIHSALNFFIDRLPPQVTLVLASRVDPPLALARRRARAQLAELRVTQLRFTRAETGEFLAASGVRLSSEDTDALDTRTDGWIAGLQLAALSLRDCRDPHAFITSFAGDDRYVVDYLLEEVLQQLPPPIHRFLLKTSILERLNGALCSEVLNHGRAAETDAAGEATAAQTPENCRAILEQLESANLFIVPLDSRRSWYRYHHLFADLLRRRLHQSLDRQVVLGLVGQACSWYEQRGLHGEAITQALAVSDFETAIELMERHILTYFYRSETMLVFHWLKSLPEDQVRSSPLLCAVYSCLVALSPPYPPESCPPSAAWLAAAEQALAQAGPGQELARGFIAKFRPFLARFRMDPPEMVIQLTLEALASLPPEIPIKPGTTDEHILNFLRFRSALFTNLGLAYLRTGREEEAYLPLQEARRLGLACGDLFNFSAACNLLANLACLHGDLAEGIRLCQELLHEVRTIRANEGHAVPYASIVGLTLGSILLERNELEEARRMLHENFELGQLSLGIEQQFAGLLAQARLALAQGDPAAALSTIQQAEARWKGLPLLADAHRTLVWLKLARTDPGWRETVIHWAQHQEFKEQSLGPLRHDRQPMLVLARALAAWQRWRQEDHSRRQEEHSWRQEDHNLTPEPPDLKEVIIWLEREHSYVDSKGWTQWRIEVLLVLALVRQAQGDLCGAAANLRESLTLAEPGRFARLFLDEGPLLVELLEKVQRSGGLAAVYAGQLLAAPEMASAPGAQHPAPPEAPAPAPEKLRPNQAALVEPLSSRELEVLNLLASGASNQEIAARLVIAPSTAKKHVLHILEKLEVASRAKAVSRARELGIL